MSAPQVPPPGRPLPPDSRTVRRLLVARGALALLSGVGALGLAAATTWWFTNLSDRCDYPEDCLSRWLPQGQAVVGPLWSISVGLAVMCSVMALALVCCGQGRVGTWCWTSAAACALWTAGRLAPGLGIGNPADRLRGINGAVGYDPLDSGPWERLALYPTIWVMLASGTVLLVLAGWTAQRLLSPGAVRARHRYAPSPRRPPLRRISVPGAGVRRIPPPGPLA